MSGDENIIPAKAAAEDFRGRFREIVSDPLNLLIERHPLAGHIIDGMVVLHNGNRVPVQGSGAYYGEFSDILIINRGVHEPLEEFAFQCLLPHMPEKPTMLELGAYWGHYSMWMQQARPLASNWMVEPDPVNLRSGFDNFKRHNYQGEFIQSLVGKGYFTVDNFMRNRKLDHLDLLHCDIQGAEAEMLEGAHDTLSNRRVGYLFVSTHSQSLHQHVAEVLESYGYRIELSADFDLQTTCHDGFMLAVHQELPAVISGEHPLDRISINQATPALLWKSLASHIESTDSTV